jgi:hypothetical protein
MISSDQVLENEQSLSIYIILERLYDSRKVYKLDATL